MSRRSLRLVAAVVTTAAAGLTVVAPATPAYASVCGTETGVTVIVDFNQLGGGVQGTCLTDGGGRYASQLFTSAGFPLSYAQRQPGFVCRVSGVPTSDPCVNTAPESAYWGLWWSDGDPGSSWTFSSLGVTSLKVPDGGLVAFSWDQNAGSEQPSAAAVRPAPAPTPAPSDPPGDQPGGHDDGSTGPDPSTPGTAPTQSPTTEPNDQPSAQPTDEPTAPQATGPTKHPRAKPDPSATSSAAPSTEPEPDASASAFPEVSDPVEPTATEPAGEGLPGWFAPAAILLLFGAAGGGVLARRRRSPQ